jgi:hypothetical protein
VDSIRIFLFATALALGVPGSRSDAPATDDAQIDRLLAVIPYSDRLNVANTPPNPEHLAYLQSLNPGRPEVRQLLQMRARCESTTMLAWTREAFRAVGRRLGSAKVERLIQFYSGPDFRALAAINERTDRGEAPTEADLATIDRIMRDYPLTAMAELVQTPDLIGAGEPNVLERVERCLAESNAAFARAGLRVTAD